MTEPPTPAAAGAAIIIGAGDATGGAIAAALAWTAVQLVSKHLMAAQFFAAEQVMLGIAAGGVLGLVGSWLSVGRHLRRAWRDA